MLLHAYIKHKHKENQNPHKSINATITSEITSFACKGVPQTGHPSAASNYKAEKKN